MIERSASKPWIIQKYGGTSIGESLDDITGSIIPGYLDSFNVVVVCSARSRSSKSEGTTSLLLEAIHYATSDETSTKDLERVIDVIKAEHLATIPAVSEHNTDHENMLLERLRHEIEEDCELLRGFLKATWTIGEMSARTQDRVLAVGERLACRIVAAALERQVCHDSSMMTWPCISQSTDHAVRAHLRK